MEPPIDITTNTSNVTISACVDRAYEVTGGVIALTVLQYILIIPIIVGNLLTVFAVGIFSMEGQQTPTDVFVGGLAVADLLVGIATIPVRTMMFLDATFGCSMYYCIVSIALNSICMGVSLLHLVALSIERYIAVLFPLRYPVLVSLKRTKIISVGIWVFTLAYVCCLEAVWDSVAKFSCFGDKFICKYSVYYNLRTLGGFAVILVVTCVLYIRILLVVRRQRKQVLLYSGHHP